MKMMLFSPYLMNWSNKFNLITIIALWNVIMIIIALNRKIKI